MKYSRKEFYALLKKFESTFKDVDFTHKGVNYYPIVRIQYAYQVYITNISGIPEQLSSNSVEKYRLSPANRIYYTILDKLKAIKLNIQKQDTAQLLLLGFKAHDTDTLLSGNGKVKSQFLAPFEYLFNKAGIQYDRENFETIKQNNTYKKIAFAFSFKNSLIKNSFAQNKNLISNLQKVETFSKENNFDFKGLAVFLLEALIENEIGFRQWLLFLKNSSYKKILTYCYYDNRVMAINRAAHELNITTIEYQHSQQSDDHFAYCSWSVNIENTRAHFPAIFWVWTASDKERIERNFSPVFSPVKSILGGNVYLSLLKEKYSSAQKKEKAVLVILQGTWVPDYVEDAVKELPEYKWYFRLHPRYPDDKPRLEKLADDFPGHVDMQEANSSQLYELFSKVNYVLTGYSGTALEAQVFGLQNIVFGVDGHNSFNTYIETGAFFYVGDKEGLKDILTKNKLSGKKHNEILIDKSKIAQRLVEVFE